MYLLGNCARSQQYFDFSTAPWRRKKGDNRLDKISHLEIHSLLTLTLSFSSLPAETIQEIGVARWHNEMAGLSLMFANDCANLHLGKIYVPQGRRTGDGHVIWACLSPLAEVSLSILGCALSSNDFKLWAFLSKEPCLNSAIFERDLEAWGILLFKAKGVDFLARIGFSDLTAAPAWWLAAWRMGNIIAQAPESSHACLVLNYDTESRFIGRLFKNVLFSYLKIACLFEFSNFIAEIRHPGRLLKSESRSIETSRVDESDPLWFLYALNYRHRRCAKILSCPTTGKIPVAQPSMLINWNWTALRAMRKPWRISHLR